MKWKDFIINASLCAILSGCIANSKNSSEKIIPKDSDNIEVKVDNSINNNQNFECGTYVILKRRQESTITIDPRCIKYEGEKLEAKVNNIHLVKKIVHKAKPIHIPHKKVYSKPVNNQIDYSNDYIINLITKTAEKYNIDPKLAIAIIKTESQFNSKALSNTGAAGIAQLMPGTARRFGLMVPDYGTDKIKLNSKHSKYKLVSKCRKDYEDNCIFDPQQDERFDPAKGIEAEIKYLVYITNFLNRNGIKSTTENISAAYNAGEGKVKDYRGIPPIRETIRFVKKVKNNYN